MKEIVITVIFHVTNSDRVCVRVPEKPRPPDVDFRPCPNANMRRENGICIVI